MVADKILMDVTLDRETHDRLKKKTGVNILNGADLMRAIVRLLNMHDMQKENIEKFIQESKKQDNVNHPQHYQGKHECIDEMIAMFGVEAVKGFCKCNVYKYRYRAGRKNGEEDLKKAEWYMDYLMKLEGVE